MKRNHKGRLDAFDVCACALLSLFAILIFYPFYNAVLTSLVTGKSYVLHPAMLFPPEVVWDNYAFILQSSFLVSGYLATIKVTALGTVYAMCASVLMAYALSRGRYPGRRTIFTLMLVTMYFSGGLIPMYLQIKNMGLMNTHAALILMAGVSPFNIIILKSSFEQLPESLAEAAKIDGAGELTIFARVALPLQLPILATFTLFVSVGYWNDWFWPMMLLKQTDLFTLQLVLRSIIVDATSDISITSGAASASVFSEGVKMAAVVATMLPIMLIYPFLQKYFVKGMLVGAVKM